MLNNFLYCSVVSDIVKARRIILQRLIWGKWVSYFLFLLVTTVFTLNQAAFALDNQDTNLRQPKKTACPSQEFPEFFSAYSNSEIIQRAFLRTPLKMQQLDLNTEPEPKPIIKKLNYSQIKFPLLPLRAERDAELLALRIDQWSEKKAKVTLFKQDTGYQITYFFIKNKCWILIAIEDWSI